jgi:hypothetical protein
MKDTSDRTSLDQVLPEIHEILVSFYRFIPEEAEAFENVLAVWHHRLARRAGLNRMSDSEVLTQLLLVTCKYARAFQLARHRGIDLTENPLAIALAQPAEEVAFRALAGMRETDRP